VKHLLDARRKILERDGQPVGVELKRLQATRDVAGAVDGLLNKINKIGGAACFIGLKREQPLVQDTSHASDSGEVLAQVVVKVLPDALPFALAGFENLPGGSATFGHVAEVPHAPVRRALNARDRGPVALERSSAPDVENRGQLDARGV
jgi:hypothetical protein